MSLDGSSVILFGLVYDALRVTIESFRFSALFAWVAGKNKESCRATMGVKRCVGTFRGLLLLRRVSRLLAGSLEMRLGSIENGSSGFNVDVVETMRKKDLRSSGDLLSDSDGCHIKECLRKECLRKERRSVAFKNVSRLYVLESL